MPFDGCWAISFWRLELPSAVRQFDYNTISDVILHVKYAAREGGDQLHSKAIEELKLLVNDASKSKLALLFSLRHDFPNEWAAFVNGVDPASFTAAIRKD